ncbi:MAG: glycosyltransferase [Opitutaceae bacterium]|nr:glycosyltransferase [Opitutaceae bacterium]
MPSDLSASRPLRILHCAVYGLRRYFELYPNIEQRLNQGFARAGHFVERFSPRDVARAEAPVPIRALGVGRMNERLVEACRNFEPDLLLLGHCELITADTIRRLVKDRATVCHAVFVTSGGEALREIAAVGCIAAHLPNPVDVTIDRERSFENKVWAHDLFFAGSEKGEPARTAFLRQLRDETPGLRFRIHKAFGEPTISGHAYFRALGTSMMGLNLSRRWDVPWYCSDRISHLLGNGVLALTPRTPGLTDLFGQDALGWYDNLEELRRLIDEMRHNPEEARRRARLGWEQARERCESGLVARWMLGVAMEGRQVVDVRWGDQVHVA